MRSRTLHGERFCIFGPKTKSMVATNEMVAKSGMVQDLSVRPRREQRGRTTHMFSVDVEEYFQVTAFEGAVSRQAWSGFPSRLAIGLDRVLEMLALRDATATFFVLGWTAKRHPALIRRIARAGHEIASHGWTHRRVTMLSVAELRQELRDSKQLLEDLSGTAVLGFRAPSFSITRGTLWALDVLIEEGYRYDSSIFPIRRPSYGLPGACPVPHRIRRTAGTLLEIPLTTLALGPMRLPAAGGGYLRHFPYELTAAALSASDREGVPGMLYLHPWELDPDQPRLGVSFLARLRHYRGLRLMAPRVERLLDEFTFSSVRRCAHPEIAAVFKEQEEGPSAEAGGHAK